MIPKIRFTIEKELIEKDNCRSLIEAAALPENTIVKKIDQDELVLSFKSEHPLLYNSFTPIAVITGLNNDNNSKIEVTLRLAKGASMMLLICYVFAVIMFCTMIGLWIMGRLCWSWLFLLPVGIASILYILSWFFFLTSARKVRKRLAPDGTGNGSVYFPNRHS